MQSWENRIVPGNFKWCGMMTIPRELTIKDGCLIQNPIREIENYYKNTVEYNNLTIKDEVSLDGIFGRELDITIDIDGSQAGEFKIKLAKNNEYETIINFNSRKNIIEFDRSYSGVYGDILHKREMKVADKNGKVKIRLIIDKYSVEIFANDGEQVMTSTFYTPLEATDITFASEGNSIINIKKHNIEV